MKKQYLDLNFRAATMAVIDKANEILEDYAAQGYKLTLRQLYYKFVTLDLIPNQDREYKKLGKAVNNGRLAGLIDWNHIVDRTRTSECEPHWRTPIAFLEEVIPQFGIDTRLDQDYYLEVWVEKDALIEVVERACVEVDVRYMSCRGFLSQSAMWQGAVRFIRKTNHGQKGVLIYLGDHDPSGLDMSRDIQDRFTMFGAPVKVNHIALTMEQVEQYNPPPNPAKVTDSRYAGYQAEHGDDSWELDALEPAVITDLITTVIEGKYTIHSRRNARTKLQTQYGGQLQHVTDNFDEFAD